MNPAVEYTPGQGAFNQISEALSMPEVYRGFVEIVVEIVNGHSKVVARNVWDTEGEDE